MLLQLARKNTKPLGSIDISRVSAIAFINLGPIQVFITGIILLVLFGWYFATDNERSKRIIGTALVVVMTFLAVVSFVPPFDIPKKDASGNVIRDEKGKAQIETHGRIKKGIDLAGGTSFLIRLQPEV